MLERVGITFPVSAYAWAIMRSEAKLKSPEEVTNQELEIIRTSDEYLYSFLYDHSTIDDELTNSGIHYLAGAAIVHRLLRHHSRIEGLRLPTLSEGILEQINDRAFDIENNRIYLPYLNEDLGVITGKLDFLNTFVREIINPVSRRLFTSLAKTTFRDMVFIFRNDKVMFGVLYNIGRYKDRDMHKIFFRDPFAFGFEGGIDMYFAYRAYNEVSYINSLMDPAGR